MNLKIKFELNEELDKHMVFDFTSKEVKSGGVDFAEGIFMVHPELRQIVDKNEEDQKKIISEYFDSFYKIHENELVDSLLMMNQNWQKDEGDFIEQLQTIFKNPEVPEGRYIGYLSIINCNPRFLHDKTFQVYYKNDAGSNHVTAHEVLHFFFYDYTDKKYPEIFANLNPNSGIYWDLAELFNAVIMSQPSFISEEYSKKTRSYPNHRKYLDGLKKIWENNPDIDNWILEAYKYLESQKSY